MNYDSNAYIQAFQRNEHKYSQMNNEQWTHGGCRSTPMFFSLKFLSQSNQNMGSAQTRKLCQLDPINERELPLKLTPHSPWGRQKKQVCFSLHAQKCFIR